MSNVNKFDNNNLMLANVLYALTKNNCERKNELNRISEKLIKRQKKNGVFYAFTNKEDNYAQAFTTIRMVISLNQFKEKCL